MEIRHSVTLLLLLVIAGCEAGNFQKRFFEVYNLETDLELLKKDPEKYKGMEAVRGPSGGQGLRFDETSDIKPLTGIPFAYTANFIQTSTDLSFAADIKIMGIKTDETLAYFPFFTMADKELDNRYFSIGLESKRSFIMVEGKKEYNDKHEWAVYIEQWVAASKSSSKTSLKLGDKLKMTTWQSIVVRIKNETVSVLMDCKEVVKGKLTEGRIKSFSYEGKMTFAQIWVQGQNGVRERKQFVGSMFKPQLINTALAYNFYTPCLNHTPSVIAAEPRGDKYDPTKFQQFQKVGNQEVKKFVLMCKTTTKSGEKITLINNGNYLIFKKCFRYKCTSGVIEESYGCPKCKDKKTRIRYKIFEDWIDRDDKCLKKTCVYPYKIIEETIKCKTLDCPANEQYQPEGKCCKRCMGWDCTQGKTWYAGCSRKCALGVAQKCATGTEKTACWCPKGQAMDHDNSKCIPTGECECRVGTKVYLPGMSSRASLCRNCICSHGLLACFETC